MDVQGIQELFRFIGRNGCASLQIRNSLSVNDDKKFQPIHGGYRM
jgi:hypothetical protein